CGYSERVRGLRPVPCMLFFFFQAEDGIRDRNVTGVQTCALPISVACRISADAVQCGNRAVALSDGSMTKAEDKAEVDPDPASSRVPLEADGEGAVTGPDDQAYDGLSLDPEAHASMIGGAQAGETGPWVVSDGQTLAAVGSDGVLWTQDLDSSAAEVTGLGDKR